jgi:iron complex transport system substrate-binding protein
MREFVLPNGKTVNLPDDPKRIVSFSPAITEILFDLGLGSRIAGVSAFCARPDAAVEKRKVGSYGSARFEVLDEINPDLVLTISGFQENFSLELSERYPTYMFELPSSLAGIVDLVSRVGITTGEIEEARHLEFELLKIIGGMRRHTKLTGYVEVDLGGPVSFGSLSYITDALSIMGIRSIYGDQNREWLKPDAEFILKSNPDIIFYEPKMYSRLTENNFQELVRNKGWDKLDAFRNGRVFMTPGKLDFFAHHGPSFIRGVLPWIQNILDEIMVG